MAVVLAVILLVTLAFGAVGVYALRSQRIEARLETLKADALELARLSVESRGASVSDSSHTVTIYPGWRLSQSSADVAYRYLNRKASEVYSDFGAYIAVANRMGDGWASVSTNISVAADLNPDFVKSLDSAELSAALDRVLQGEEIAVRTMVNGDPTFTVGVPWTQDGQVRGAALIQTPAQRIEGNFWEIALPLGLIALGATALSGVVLFFILRRQLKPLKDLRDAADAMAEGDFSVRVETRQPVPEMAVLSGAFNTMADKLGTVEQGRREFVANVSHELRSPITSITGFVQGMEDGTIPPEDHPKYLAMVGTESRRLSKLVEDLLNLSRLEQDDAALNLSVFDLCEMARRAVIRRMKDLEAKGIEVATEFDPDPCLVRADADRIEEVLINLVDNAVKFTPDGGRITLRIEADGGKVTATVADSGPGVRPEDRPHIFERFFTADRAHTAGKGTGLGLPICRRILAMHGERIWLRDSTEGAAFSFTLPMEPTEKKVQG